MQYKFGAKIGKKLAEFVCETQKIRIFERFLKAPYY